MTNQPQDKKEFVEFGPLRTIPAFSRDGLMLRGARYSKPTFALKVVVDGHSRGEASLTGPELRSRKRFATKVLDDCGVLCPLTSGREHAALVERLMGEMK